MSAAYDRILQESTLFELFKSEAYTDTEKSLRLALANINAKLLKYSDDTWTKRRLKEVQKYITDEITIAYGGLFETLNEEVTAIIPIVSSSILAATVPISVINELMSPSRLIQGYNQKDLFKVTSDNHARQLNVIIGSGVSQGKSVASILRDINLKSTSLAKHQLNNAIFTTITEARATIRHNSFKELEKSGVIKGYEYVAVLDSRTTEYCRNHDNRKYYKSISEIQSEINVHWHCRSVFVPFSDSSKVDSRATQFGPIPEESYGTWFSKQSKDFQKITLGTRKYNLYIKGQYKVGGLPDILGQKLSLSAINTTLN